MGTTKSTVYVLAALIAILIVCAVIGAFVVGMEERLFNFFQLSLKMAETGHA